MESHRLRLGRKIEHGENLTLLILARPPQASFRPAEIGHCARVT